jgi:phospholipid/cholesterol/gamma-HCH transport system substrate-binding protein
MKVSNETKVGILTISALTILVLGFNFLKNNNLFKKRKLIYAVFPNLGGISRANEVKINGYLIGTVYKLNKKDRNADEFIVSINVTEEINIPKDSKAIISSPLVGSWYINIEKGHDTAFLKIGDTLRSKKDIGILDDMKAQLTPTLEKVRGSLDTLNILLNNVNGLLSSDAKANLHQTLANLNKASSSLNTMLDAETGSIAKTIANANDFVDNLKKNTQSIGVTMENAKKASEKLAALELQPTIDSLKSTINLLKASAAKITSKEGSLGAMISDKSLYNELTRTIIKAQTLVDDLRVHPKRYVNLSIFGKKDKGNYLTLPTDDSAFLQKQK